MRGAERRFRLSSDDNPRKCCRSTTAVRRTVKRKATSEVATYSSDCAAACVPCSVSWPGVRLGKAHADAFLTRVATL